MRDNATTSLQVEWRPSRGVEDRLILSMRLPDGDAFRRLAATLDAGTVLRVRALDGSEVITTTAAVLGWTGVESLPPADGSWCEAPSKRGDGAIAIDMLDAFLAWTKSRGLIDETVAQRIGRSVQIELAGAARGTPD